MSLTSEVVAGGLDWKAAQSAVFCHLACKPLFVLFEELGFVNESYHQFLSLNKIGDPGVFFKHDKGYRDYCTLDGTCSFFRCLESHSFRYGLEKPTMSDLVAQYILMVTSFHAGQHPFKPPVNLIDVWFPKDDNKISMKDYFLLSTK